jgi:hypothetical protein
MSTYSDNLKIEEIGTGEQAGTWGVTTNDNFVNVFEQAIVGRVTVAFSNADVTLTATNSVSSQSFRNVYLNCTGTNAASRNLIVPTINKNYVVQNNTTGGFDIVVKTTAGTGITVPNGRTCTVYADGTNVIQAFDYLPTLNVPTLNITTLDATNIEVTNIKAKDGTASATIADSTGIFTHSTVTVFTAGTVSAPAITTTGDTNTGIFFPAADTIAFTEGGVESMRIDSSGYLGIGTTNPLHPLDIRSNFVSQVTIGAVSGNTNASLNLTPTGTGVATVGPASAFPLTFRTDAVERMRIDASGNVGIGTSSPSSNLHVAGTTGAVVSRVSATTGAAYNLYANTGGNFYVGKDNSAGSSFGTAAYSTVLYSDGAYPMVFFTNATSRMTLDASGNLGLGVTPSPWSGGKAIERGFAGTADWGFSQASSYRTTNAYFNSGFKYGGTGAASIYSQEAGQHSWGIAPSGTAGNAITFNQAMTLTTSGNLGIGLTNAPVQFAVSDNSNGSYAGFSSSRSSPDFFANIAVQGESGGWQGIMRFLVGSNGTAATERMRITPAGDVGIGTSSPSNKLDVFGVTRSQVQSGATNNTAPIAVIVSNKTTGAHAAGLGSSLQFSYENSGGGYAGGQISSVASADPFTADLRFFPRNYGYTEAMRIDSSGNVGIGTSSPQARLNVAVTRTSGTNTNALFLSDNVTGAQTVGFGTRIIGSSNSGNALSAINFEAGGGGTNNDTQIGFYTQSSAAALTKRLTIGYTGMVALQGGDANATGTGIAFPATQNASSNANTLDDYEEGTWAPNIAFGGSSTGITYSEQFGLYVKVGQFCWLQVTLTLTSKGSATGHFGITNIPFASSAVNGHRGGGTFGFFADMPNVNGIPVVYGVENGITLDAYDAADNISTAVNLDNTNLTNTSTIRFVFTYRTGS